MALNEITYDYAPLNDACQQLLQYTREIASHVDDLVAQVNQNRDAYLSGKASDQYGATAIDLSKTFDDEVNNLTNTAHATLHGADDVHAIDRQMASMFRG
jgi:uncharacterized protein YukE